MKQEAQPRRWYPKGRKAHVVLWFVYVLSSLPVGLFWLREDGHLLWMGILYVTMSALGGLQAWNAIRRRVEADDRGLRVVDSLRPRVILWEDIDAIRPDAGGAWATRLVVVTRDGEVVPLPLEPTQTEPVKRWKESIAD